MDALRRIQEYRDSHGAAYTLRRLTQIFMERKLGSYDRLRAGDLPTEEELAYQRENQPDAGLISVVIPVYNTDPRMLEELLDDLRKQTYQNLDVVLYDGGSTRAETISVLDRAGEGFRVIHAAENKGISGNTNEAIALARGEYVALCDHDDRLTPDALWRMAERIARDRPDVLYSDEDRITEDGSHHMDPHFKPEYNPETLVSDNYICHLAVIRKCLLEEIGGLRSGFDGSQDHDLFLRLAEKTDRFAHVPYTLYSWREVSSSRSHLDLQTCLENACQAAEEHEARCGRSIKAEPVNKAIRLWAEPDPETSVEALIYGQSEEECRACWDELKERTTWRNLSAALIVTDEEKRFEAINEAARASKAECLLLLEASVYGMNRHFIRELMMFVREGIAGVTPVLTDRKEKITHAGFALGREKTIAACINEGLYVRAGGWHDLMNKVHNVSAVSPCCLLVRKDCWEDFDPAYRSGLAAADLGLRQKEAGRRYVFTPHAQAKREKCSLLLSGKERDAGDIERFTARWGNPEDPCYSSRFERGNANYKY